MCDSSGKLMAWLDRELSDDQMAKVQHHIGECTECRTQVAKYERARKTFDAYCDAVAAVKARGGRRWAPMLSAVAAAMVAATLALVLLRAPADQPSIPPTVVAASQADVLESMPTSGKAVHRLRAASHRQVQTAAWLRTEPAIQIVIPAESYQTCHRRFQSWQRSGLLTRLLQKLAVDLRDRGKLDLSESFIDASFSGAKRGHWCRPYKARQRQQNHGDRRRPWSSFRRARGQRFAA